MKKHDIVVSTSKINIIPKGTIGTIVHVYGHIPGLYEVEFIINNSSLVETVSDNQIKLK